MQRSYCFPTVFLQYYVVYIYYLSIITAVAGQNSYLCPVPAENMRGKGVLVTGSWVQEAEEWDPFKPEKVSGLTGSQQGAEPERMTISWTWREGIKAFPRAIVLLEENLLLSSRWCWDLARIKCHLTAIITPKKCLADLKKGSVFCLSLIYNYRTVLLAWNQKAWMSENQQSLKMPSL